MSIFPDDIVKKTLQLIQVDQIIELMDYRRDTIQDSKAHIKCFCPIHNEKVFRTLTVDKKEKNYKCSYSLCDGRNGGDLIDLYAKSLEIDYDDALERLVDALGLDIELPRSQEFIDKLVEVCQNYLELGAVDDAEREFKKILRMQPENIPAHNGLLEVASLKKNDDKIIEELKELVTLELEAHNYENVLLHSNRLLERKSDSPNVRRSVAAAHAGLGDTPSAVGELMTIAEDYEIEGNLDKSLEIFREIESLNPDFLDISPYINNILIASGKTDQVINETIEKSDAYFADQDYERSLECLSYVLELDESRDDIREKYVTCVLGAGLNQERVEQCVRCITELIEKDSLTHAIQLTQSLLELESGNFTLVNLLIDIYSRQGNDEEVRALQLQLADIYVAQGNSDEAIGILEGILQNDPSSREALSKLADVFLSKDDKDNAIQRYKQLCDFLVDAKNHSDAVEVLNKLIDLEPESIEYKEMLINVYNDAGKQEEAISTLEGIIDAFVADKKYEDAVGKIESFLDNAPDSIVLHTRLAEIYSAIGDYEKTKQKYLELCEIHRKNNDLQSAIRAVQTMLEFTPSDTDMEYKLALLFLDIGDSSKALKLLKPVASELRKTERLDEAVDAFKQILSITPDNVQALSQLAEIYKTLGNGGELLETYSSLVEIFYEKKSFNRAIEHINFIVEIDPQNINALSRLPTIYQTLRKSKKAITAYFDLAEAYSQLGDRHNELNAYESIVGIDSSNISAQKKILRLSFAEGETKNAVNRLSDLAAVLVESEEYQEGIDFLKDLLEVAKDSAAIHALLLNFYEKSGDSENAANEAEILLDMHEQKQDFEMAVDYCRRLLHYRPEDLGIHERLINTLVLLDRNDEVSEEYTVLARLNVKNNKLDEAQQNLRDAVEIAPENEKPRQALVEFHKSQNNVEAYENSIFELSDLYFNKKEFENALSVLDQFVAGHSDNIEARKRIIDIHHSQDNLELVVEEYRKIIQGKEKSGDVKGVTSNYRKALETVPGAVSLRREFIEFCKKHNDSENVKQELFALASTLSSVSQHEESLMAVNELLELEPDNLRAKRLRAELFAKMGRDKEALAEFLDLSAILEMMGQSTQPEPQPSQPVKFSIVEDYTFESFVVGSRNNFAYATCLAVAKAPAENYNPLFLYSDVGLGKTHLINAVANYILKNESTQRILYTSSEEFTSELIDSIQNNRVNTFRSMYKSTDVLLIDDIQFLAGRERAQEEFFHIFNTLFQAKRQIVITSDCPPKDIAHLEKRLRSRFGAGIVVDIQSPDLETRIAILKKLLTIHPEIAIEDPILAIIAQRIESNVRDLKGALNQIIAKHQILNQEITADLVKDTLDSIG